MDGHGQAVTDAGHGTERVRARAQVGHLAEVLEGVALRRDGVAVRVVDPADDLERLGLQLHALALALGGCQDAADDDRAARRQAQHVGLVVGQGRGRHDLERGEAGAVVDLHEGQPGLRVATGAHPARDGDSRAHQGLAGQDVGDADRLRHGRVMSSCMIVIVTVERSVAMSAPRCGRRLPGRLQLASPRTAVTSQLCGMSGWVRGSTGSVQRPWSTSG